MFLEFTCGKLNWVDMIYKDTQLYVRKTTKQFCCTEGFQEHRGPRHSEMEEVWHSQASSWSEPEGLLCGEEQPSLQLSTDLDFNVSLKEDWLF